jgi:ceramide glucosyltransferase
MALHIMRVFAAISGVLGICGIGYYLLCLWSARSFLRQWRSTERRDFAPPVSILKPLRGADPGMYEAFRSHCLQDYPEYELIFGVSGRSDPAVAEVERLQREFPERRIELIVCPLVLGTNLKVSNLVQMLPHAQYQHLLINDSDIRVPPDYLRRITSPFANPRVGMVTSLYRGAPGRTLGSKLESVGISTDFAPNVLAARQLEGVHFALGSTLAIARRSLNAIGGFEPLLDYLADDYELGNRVAAAGEEVVLSDVVVDTHLPDYSFWDYWRHQLRWARGVRDSRKWGYLGTALTFGLPWSLLAFALSRGALWAGVLLAVCVCVRTSVALFVVRRVLDDPRIPWDLWLLPLRDVMGLILWAASYAGHCVTWRGDLFLLEHGKLRRLEAAGESRRCKTV